LALLVRAEAILTIALEVCLVVRGGEVPVEVRMEEVHVKTFAQEIVVEVESRRYHLLEEVEFR
jgi:hypothetical protein